MSITTPIVSFADDRLVWSNGEPSSNGGSWCVDSNGGNEELIIVPEPSLDYWSRTFYAPLLVKHDAQTLLASVPEDAEATISTAFTLTPVAQFDQAGVMVLVDVDTWVKAGIEFTDGVPRLSCVVTNDGFSDWSTQEWSHWDPANKCTSVRIRVSKLLPGADQGPAMVMEAATYNEGDTVDSPGDWFQVRISSLRSGDKPWKIGFFSIAPIAQEGSSARFHHMTLGDKVAPVHSTDPGC